MRNNITPTVEGGLLTAIAVVLGLASVYVPVFGVVIEFFLAVPIVVLTVRQGVGKGFMSVGVSFLLLSMFVGPLLSSRIALSFGICGLVLGFCILKNFDAVKCFLSTLVAAFVAQIIAVAILTAFMGINVMETQLDMVKESFDQSFRMYESMGIEKAEIDEARDRVEPTLKLLSYLMPVLLLCMALINTVACWLTAHWIFPKLRLKIPELPAFKYWKFPQVFMYIAAFSLIGLYWGGTREITLLYEISVNCLVFAMVVGVIQGFSLMSFFADRHNVSKFMRRLIFLILILNMMLLEIVAFTGLFDMIFDYRKRFSGD